MISRGSILAAAVLCAGLPGIAGAAGPVVSLDSAVFVERTSLRDGTPVRALERAGRLTRGDRIVTIINWRKPGADRSRHGGFTVVNAVPAGLSYQRSALGDEDVSVDGSRTWGKLAQLHIGARQAAPEDVTHVRWHVSPQQAMSGAGSMTYAGFVR